MEVKIGHPHRNLLSKSLTARIKRSDDQNAGKYHQTRHQSLKNLIHLNGLKIQNGNDVSPRDYKRQRETGPSPRSIQKHVQRAERERSVLFDPGLRTRSDLSSVMLPRLMGSESSMSQTPVKEDFSQFAFIDKDDVSHVKVFKIKGIFQPQNKYYNKIEPMEISEKAISFPSPDKHEKDGNTSRNAESRTPADSPNDPPKSRMSRMSKKGLRVSWSRRSQYYSANDEDEDDDDDDAISDTSYARTDVQTPKPGSRPDSRQESVKTPSTVKSFSMKSEHFFVKKPHSKRKVDTIGLKWAIPVGDDKKPKETIRKPVRTKFGHLSHNLMPVTKALDKSGRSTSKVRWKVQSSDSLRNGQLYQHWVDQLADLKACQVDCLSDNIPNRANLSVMTQPVK